MPTKLHLSALFMSHKATRLSASRSHWLLLLLSAVLFLSACSGAPKKPKKTPGDSSAAELSVSEAYAIWGKVLREHVSARGRIDFVDLFRGRKDIDRFVGWIYANSPEKTPKLFPSRNDQVAFHINAYNALAMYNILEAKLPSDFNSMMDRYRFYNRREVEVGGRRLSLVDYEKKLIKPLGEVRMQFALSCMVKGCPRLAQKPYFAATISTQLDQAASLFINDPRNVYIDTENEKLALSQVFKDYKSEFSALSGSLVGYINNYRRQPVPESYKIRYEPFDWHLNYAR